MIYDIFANFYKKVTDSTPTYRCPLGVFAAPSLNFFAENGFANDPDTTVGYQDYIKDVEVEELQQWTQEGFISEVMDIIYGDEDFERITLQAIELDSLDDNGTLPLRGLQIGACFVKFGSTEPFAPVTFIEGDPYEMTQNTRRFIVPLKKLKDYFDVNTMMQVMERMQTFTDGDPWTYEQLKDYFEAGIDDAVALATRVFFGLRDRDGNPQILHALAVGMKGLNKTQKIAGFLHDVVKDSGVTLEDLAKWGFSQGVVEVVDLLTYRGNITYQDYINNILHSGNLDAVLVKFNDLGLNVERDKSGGHTKSLEKHQLALDTIGTVLIDALKRIEPGF